MKVNLTCMIHWAQQLITAFTEPKHTLQKFTAFSVKPETLSQAKNNNNSHALLLALNSYHRIV